MLSRQQFLLAKLACNVNSMVTFFSKAPRRADSNMTVKFDLSRSFSEQHSAKVDNFYPAQLFSPIPPSERQKWV